MEGRLLHVDMAHRHEATSEHVHGRLRLLQDDVPGERFFVYDVSSGIRFHEDHFVGNRTKALDPDLHGPARFPSHDAPVGQLELHRFGTLEIAQPLLPRGGKDQGPGAGIDQQAAPYGLAVAGQVGDSGLYDNPAHPEVQPSE